MATRTKQSLKGSGGGSRKGSGGGSGDGVGVPGGRSRTPTPPPASAMGTSRKKAPPPPDDDDDSDLDILSISSEDEVGTSRPPAIVAAGRVSARASPDVGVVGGLLMEDDYEPASWKGVREEEIVWRVREMREKGTSSGRADSAAQLRRTSRVTGEADSLADPLGLGTINLRSLSLARPDRPESPRNKTVPPASKDKPGQKKPPRGREEGGGQRSREDLPAAGDAAVDPADREKLVFYSDTFDPRFYLARIHRESAVADLKAGQTVLKRDMYTRKEQLKKLVKDNFDCFVSCKNTIDDIHLRLQEVETDTEGAGTAQLYASIQNVAEIAKKAFGPLLERQAQAERIRSVQGLLLRFRTLFNLPCTIRTHIKKKEYDQVVREYRKAKSLILPSKLGILKKVLEEIDKVVREFRDMLYRSMEDPNMDTAEVEKIVRLLSELEPESDPIWHFLNLQDRRIRGLMENCVVEGDTRMQALLKAVREQMQFDSRLRATYNLDPQGGQNATDGDAESSENFEAAVKEAAGEEMARLEERLIQKLTTVLINNLPGFWRLTISIFTGKFGKVTFADQSGGQVQSPPRRINKAAQAKFPQYYEDDKVDDGIYKKQSQGDVVKLLMGMIGLYITKVQAAFIRMAESCIVQPYIVNAVDKVAHACTALKGNDCVPESAAIALLGLRTEVTRICVTRLCTHMRDPIAELVADEDWIPVPTVNRNGTPFAVTSVPLRLGDLITASMEPVSSVMSQTVTQELTVEENMMAVVKSIQEIVKTTLFDCFIEFAECLAKASAELTRKFGKEGAEANGGEIIGEEQLATLLQGPRDGDECGRVRAGVEVTATHQRLLLLISNSSYCRTYLLPDIVRRYQHLWTSVGAVPSQNRSGLKSPLHPQARIWVHPSPSHGSSFGSESEHVGEASDTMASLEDKLIDQYLKCKAQSLEDTALAYLFEDKMPWGSFPPPKGLRDAALELIHPLVAVHAEVYSGARPCTEKAISGLAESLVLALKSVCSAELKVLDAYGYCQLFLELDYFETVLAPFSTPALEEVIKGVREVLLEKAIESRCTISPDENMEASHNRRQSKDSSSDGGSVDIPRSALAGGGAYPASMEDVQALARSYSQSLLANELKRTRINVICFTEAMGDLVAQAGGPVGSGVLARRGVSTPLLKAMERASNKVGSSPTPGFLGDEQVNLTRSPSTGASQNMSRSPFVAPSASQNITRAPSVAASQTPSAPSSRRDGNPQQSPARPAAVAPRTASEALTGRQSSGGKPRPASALEPTPRRERQEDGQKPTEHRPRMTQEMRREYYEKIKRQSAAGHNPRRAARPQEGGSR